MMTNDQSMGFKRFKGFLDQLQSLLTTANKQKNPALWLYRNDARTPLFMLEGLSKMYANLHNGKKFTRLKEHFKSLEDVLGAIDYYDAIARDLGTIKKIPVEIMNYLHAQSREKVQSFNEILIENDWLAAENGRITKIINKLQEAKWMEEEEEVNAMNEFYGAAIYKIIAFTKSPEFHFDNVEADIHELRRQLRWLSIYPRALGGTVQLGKNKPAPKHLLKYCTKEIITSPFNTMPPAGEARYFLLLEQNHFYALSWMIATLGKIKDEGLHVIGMKEAIQQANAISDEEAFKKTYQVPGRKQPRLEDLLKKAETICKIFFKEKILENLVLGTGRIT